MKLLRFAILLILSSVAASGYAAEDSDSLKFSELPWFKQLAKNNFDVNAPGINYPRFARFCLKVYNWGDKTFNTYDSTYVVGTGKNWKAMLRSYNWNDGFALYFNRKNYLYINSDIYSDLGAHLSFMAVSIGYAVDANAYFGGGSSGSRHNFNFNFVCALFSAGISSSKATGGTTINHFGDYSPESGRLKYKFDDISQESLSGTIYYFFNHRKYSQGAAYNFSRYQLKSAGSWLSGFSFSNQRIKMDFSRLPDELTSHLPSLEKNYHFRYTDYDILGGYGYNWVLKPRKWLINGTIMPSVGYKHSYEGTTEGRRDMFSTNIRGNFSIVYNHRSLFAAMIGNYEGHFYFARGFTFYNSIASLSLVAGVRF